MESMDVSCGTRCGRSKFVLAETEQKDGVDVMNVSCSE